MNNFRAVGWIMLYCFRHAQFMLWCPLFCIADLVLLFVSGRDITLCSHVLFLGKHGQCGAVVECFCMGPWLCEKAPCVQVCLVHVLH